MEILAIDYSGYITIDKNDMVVFSVDPKTGEQTTVDPNTLDTDTLLEKIENGDLYVDLGACLKSALDGEQTIEVELEEGLEEE